LKLGQKRQGRLGSGNTLVSALTVGALALLAGFIAVPLLSLVVWMVDREDWQTMVSPVAINALLLSARTTAASMATLLVVGTPAAYILARGSFRGKRVLNTLMDIPVVLPPSAAGIALLLAFGRMGLLGEHLSLLGINLPFTTTAVVLAELFVATPFYVRQAVTGFSEVDREIEEAAMVDGASLSTTFLRITLPLASPALVAGAITAWARALGEFGATIIFAGNLPGITQTVPLAIYSALESNFNAAVALSVLVLVFAFTIILAVRYLTRKVTEYQNQR
jgi:molybdate transport system permease protein